MLLARLPMQNLKSFFLYHAQIFFLQNCLAWGKVTSRRVTTMGLPCPVYWYQYQDILLLVVPFFCCYFWWLSKNKNASKKNVKIRFCILNESGKITFQNLKSKNIFQTRPRQSVLISFFLVDKFSCIKVKYGHLGDILVLVRF